MRYLAFVFSALSLSACATHPQQGLPALERKIATTGIPFTDEYAGRPPAKFMTPPRAMDIAWGTLDACGKPPTPNSHFVACITADDVVHAGNPCDYDGELALYLCHEMAHLNGWPKNHGDR
jgi:hypothetical protein